MKSTTYVAAHDGFEIVGFKKASGTARHHPVIGWVLSYDDAVPVLVTGPFEGLQPGTRDPDAEFALVKNDVVLRASSGSKGGSVRVWLDSLRARK